MAFIDTAVPYAQAGVSAQVGGAPSGGGIRVGVVPSGVGQPGGGAPGTNASLRTWVIIFYAVIGGTLLAAGVIFNGKG